MYYYEGTTYGDFKRPLISLCFQSLTDMRSELTHIS